LSLRSLLGLGMTGKAFVLPTTLEFIKGDSDRFAVIYECLVLARLGQKFKTSAVWDTRLSDAENRRQFADDVREKAAELGYTVSSVTILNL
jgi:hypothetical protein